ncbi:MAG: hypothetical protein HGA35_01890 [Erysipelotrichaceae bacterium]|nr:hypothetical protein [Erysipelotrichaceae bacterium]
MKIYIIQNTTNWKNNSSKELLFKLSQKFNLENPFHLESGKPVLHNGYVSISHSNNYLLIAYSNRPIGIDCEIIRPIQKALIDKLNLDPINPIIDWCKREAVIKLMDDKSYLLKKELNEFHFKSISFNPNLCIIVSSKNEIRDYTLIHLDQYLNLIEQTQ